MGLAKKLPRMLSDLRLIFFTFVVVVVFGYFFATLVCVFLRADFQSTLTSDIKQDTFFLSIDDLLMEKTRYHTSVTEFGQLGSCRV